MTSPAEDPPPPTSSPDTDAFFEAVYEAADREGFDPPWDRRAPLPLIVSWAEERDLDGTGRTALVVGAGTGDDAEFLAARGFSTTAFDVSTKAIELARRRYPDSAVDYRVADLLSPPAEWVGGFDLVVESLTAQSLPDPVRPSATERIASLVAPGGTLLVCASSRPEDEPASGPPWPLARSEIEAFATGGLELGSVETLDATPDGFGKAMWRAELRRP